MLGIFIKTVSDVGQPCSRQSSILDFAIVYQGLGDYDQVFHHFEEVASRRMGAMVFLAHSIFWGEDIRKDARFDALLEQIGHPMMVGV